VEGRTAEAIKELDAALKEFPAYAQARVWKGKALFEAGKLPLALKEFARAAADDPNDAYALIGQATCLQRLGRAQEAHGLFERSKALAPALFAEAA
jgi:tetratricopeptide (TPR) repeat protein